MSPTTLGVVLAGGRGERFGGAKALARYRGVTLLDRARATLGEACDEVVVVAPAPLDLPVPDSERVPDAFPGEGPLSALVAGLESRRFDRAFALAVDVPRIEARHVRRLIAAAGDAPALVPAPGGRLQPLAAVYAARAAVPLRAELDRGGRALVPAVRALGPRLLDDAALAALEVPPACLEDADTPEALVRMEALEG